MVHNMFIIELGEIRSYIAFLWAYGAYVYHFAKGLQAIKTFCYQPVPSAIMTCQVSVVASALYQFTLCMLLLGSLAYLTAATHGLVDECEEIKSTFKLDPEKVC